MVTILIAGGGTGGHVFPMVAVGDAVRAVDPSARVVYVGTARGIEARVIPERGDVLELLDIRPLRGAGLRGFATGAFHAATSIPRARDLVRRLAPGAVLSVGGYAGGPVALAARSLGVPVALLEPNSVVGLSNRLLAPVVVRAYTAFPEAERYLRPSVVLRAGVPLRRAFARSPYVAKPDRVDVLVLGGSQGAKALNEVVPRAIARAVAQGAALHVRHQTGRDRDVEVRGVYEALGVGARAEVVAFIDDVAAALGAADIVVARSGASSYAELCAVGRASILVPYPHAADDHQLGNARSLERAGASVALPQVDATVGRLADELRRLAADAPLRARMAAAAAALGTPDAAVRVASDLLSLARPRAAGGEGSRGGL